MHYALEQTPEAERSEGFLGDQRVEDAEQGVAVLRDEVLEPESRSEEAVVGQVEGPGPVPCASTGRLWAHIFVGGLATRSGASWPLASPADVAGVRLFGAAPTA